MILVIGDAYQGKLSYVLKEFGFERSDVLFAGSSDCEMFDKPIISGLHLLVNRLLSGGINPAEYILGKLEGASVDIIISDTIGGGVTPVARTERIWQEECGKLLQALVARADRVIRVHCGLPQVIKG